MTTGPVELTFDPECPPLHVHPGDVVRVGDTRISLDLVVEQYEYGMTPEDMVRAYSTLDLAEVYAAIAYYLRHRNAVRTYIERREKRAEELRREIEAKHPPISREELLARRKAAEELNASPRQ